MEASKWSATQVSGATWDGFEVRIQGDMGVDESYAYKPSGTTTAISAPTSVVSGPTGRGSPGETFVWKIYDKNQTGSIMDATRRNFMDTYNAGVANTGRFSNPAWIRIQGDLGYDNWIPYPDTLLTGPPGAELQSEIQGATSDTIIGTVVDTQTNGNALPDWPVVGPGGIQPGTSQGGISEQPESKRWPKRDAHYLEGTSPKNKLYSCNKCAFYFPIGKCAIVGLDAERTIHPSGTCPLWRSAKSPLKGRSVPTKDNMYTWLNTKIGKRIADMLYRTP
jgi:hypothetical protein